MSIATLETLIGIAGEAAAVVTEVYDTQFAVDYKAPKDPVTEADRRANELICRRLAEEFPGVPCVAEESDPASFADYQRSERIFFVDPLDGTAEFVKRNGEFAVMIGLVEGNHPTAGVIHAPALGKVYAGLVGAGAWLVGPDGSRAALRPSEVAEVEQATLVVSRSHSNQDLKRALEVIGARRCVSLGGAGLKGAAVACADAEAYIAPGYSGKRWDACASEAIVCAAGGAFTDSYGKRFDYRSEHLANDRGVAVTNGRIHEEIIARLERFRRERGGGPIE